MSKTKPAKTRPVYEQLVSKLLDVLSGDVLPPSSWLSPERIEITIAEAVAKETGTTPERWQSLPKTKRIPLLEKAVVSAEGRPVPNVWIHGVGPAFRDAKDIMEPVTLADVRAVLSKPSATQAEFLEKLERMPGLPYDFSTSNALPNASPALLKDRRPGDDRTAEEHCIHRLYTDMHTLNIPGTPRPPYARLTRQEAHDELQRITNVVREHVQEQAKQEGQKAVTAGMPWQEAAKRLERLRAQGEAWTSCHVLAEKFSCPSGTIYKAIKSTPELKSWAKQKTATASRAQSINDVVTDNTTQDRVPNPEDDAAIREHLEREDLKPEERAFFNGLSRENQLLFLNDPDKHQKIFGRKP